MGTTCLRTQLRGMLQKCLLLSSACPKFPVLQSRDTSSSAESAALRKYRVTAEIRICPLPLRLRMCVHLEIRVSQVTHSVPFILLGSTEFCSVPDPENMASGSGYKTNQCFKMSWTEKNQTKTKTHKPCDIRHKSKSPL